VYPDANKCISPGKSGMQFTGLLELYPCKERDAPLNIALNCFIQLNH